MPTRPAPVAGALISFVAAASIGACASGPGAVSAGPDRLVDVTCQEWGELDEAGHDSIVRAISSDEQMRSSIIEHEQLPANVDEGRLLETVGSSIDALCEASPGDASVHAIARTLYPTPPGAPSGS
jgi:hypothetical protein